MPVGCESVACSGKGCVSPGSHKSTTGKIPAAFHDAEIRSQALSQRASITHHSLGRPDLIRSEEHTSELQSRFDLVCRLLLEKKKKKNTTTKIEYIES